MPVPSTITDLSPIAGSNYPAGSESPITTDNYLRAHASFIAELRDLNFAAGPATATAGVSMKIDRLMEPASPQFPVEDAAGIWPGPVYSFAAISHTFTASDGSGFPAPAVGLYVHVNSYNSPADIVGVMSDVVARTADDSVFAGNFIARNDAGTTNTKLVGIEIDIEPTIGTTVSTQSVGLAINAFTLSAVGPAIQIGGVASGSFSNGLLIDGMAPLTGVGIAPVGSAQMDALINTGAGVYNTAAIILSNTHKLIFRGVAANAAYLFNDSSNFFHIVGGTAGTVIRNNADSSTLLGIAEGGVVSISATGTINWDIAQSGTTVGAAGAAAAPPATPEKYISVQIAGVAYRIPAYK